jgi:hypothetical protein
MAQVFHPAANTLAKISLAAVALGPVALICGASAISRSAFNTNVGIPLDQPIPFSHEHHINELGIDCRYCHVQVEKSANATLPATETCMSCHSQIWTNSPLLQPVRDSYTTGKPIKWNVVNKVPEFVYFNHSIHINRGVQCNTCHGTIQKMQLVAKGKPFFMVWCLECHRNPEKFIGKREDVFSFYEKVQLGEEKLTPEERTLADHGEVSRSAAGIEEGKKRVKEYGIKTKQLADCWICHR